MRNKNFKEELKERYKGPFMATDIIIRYDNGKKKGIVLIDRKFFPFGIALPGGFAEHMTFEENAIKEAREETGLDICLDSPNHPLRVCSDPKQDPRAFIASVAYTAIGRGKLKPQKDEDAKSAQLYTLEELAELIEQPLVWAVPHHIEIIKDYLEEVKNGKRIW